MVCYRGHRNEPSLCLFFTSSDAHFLLLSQVLCTYTVCLAHSMTRSSHACLFSISQLKCCVREVFPESSLSSTFTRLDFNVSSVLNTNRNASGHLYMGCIFPFLWEVNSVSGLHCSLIPFHAYFIEQWLLHNLWSVNMCWKRGHRVEWVWPFSVITLCYLIYIHPATVACFRGRHPGRPAGGEFMRFGDCNEEEDGSSSRVPEL